MLFRCDRKAVAGAHVVEQEIPERVKLLAPERLRNREGAAVDRRAGGRRHQRTNVARGAADFVEEPGPFLRLGLPGKLLVARGRLGRPDEAREVVDVFETILPGRIV